jgi:ABC-type transport system involved in multi-copper enzyme maturation permease subunit
MTSFAGLARMEWIRLRSLRSTAWILAIFAAGMIGLAILALGIGTPGIMSPQARAAFDPTEQGFAGLIIGGLVISVLGVLVITGEYSSGMIRATLAAVPRRSTMLAAKAAVLGAATLAAGEVLAFAAFLAGEAVLRGSLPHASLGQPAVLRAVVLAGAAPCLLALMGLGLGTLIRHTAGAVTAALAVFFLLPFAVTPLPHSAAIKSWLPLLLAENSLSAVKPVPEALSPWVALLMMCVYTAATLIAGGVALTRRDA